MTVRCAVIALVLTGCASASAGTATQQYARDANKPTFCIRYKGAADSSFQKLIASIEAPGSGRLPPYLLQAVAGEIAVRLPFPFADSTRHSGVVSFIVRANGTADSVRIDSAGNASFDSAIVLAVQQSGALQQFAFQPADQAKPPVALKLRMWTEITRPQPVGKVIELSREQQAEPIPGNPHPRMPRNAVRAGVGDEVLAQFILNEAGRPEAESLKILKVTYREYYDAVLAVLPFIRYRPAEIQGCVVRVLVQQPFLFEIGSPR